MFGSIRIPATKHVIFKSSILLISGCGNVSSQTCLHFIESIKYDNVTLNQAVRKIEMFDLLCLPNLFSLHYKYVCMWTQYLYTDKNISEAMWLLAPNDTTVQKIIESTQYSP